MDLRDGQSFAIAGLVDNHADTTVENSRNRQYPDTWKAIPKHVVEQKQKRAVGDCYAANCPADDGRSSAAGPGVSGTIFRTECAEAPKTPAKN